MTAQGSVSTIVLIFFILSLLTTVACLITVILFKNDARELQKRIALTQDGVYLYTPTEVNKFTQQNITSSNLATKYKGLFLLCGGLSIFLGILFFMTLNLSPYETFSYPDYQFW